MKRKNPRISITDFYKPSKKALINSQRRLLELDRLRIELMFGDGNRYTKDELKAMHYISSDKIVPKELEQRLLATKEQRLRRFNSTPLEMTTNEEVEMLTGIKLK